MSEAVDEVVVGLHMIVRDEERVIGRCLDAILPGVDRVVITDTGSTDGTSREVDAAIKREWARTPGESRLYAYSDTIDWPGSFGDARQHALDELLTRYPEVTHVVWCDADDIVIGAEHLRAYAAALPDGSPGYLGHYAYGFGPSGELTVSHYRERLVRRDALHGWSGAIHENLLVDPGPWSQLPVPQASQLQAPWPRDVAGIEWVHDPAPGGRQADRNRVILEADLEREIEQSGRGSVRTLGYLAQEYQIAAAVSQDEEERERWNEKAYDCFERVWDHPDRDEQTYQLVHRFADLCRDLGDLRRAQDLDEAMSKERPGWPDAWIGLARTHMMLGEYELALTYLDVGLSKPYPQTGLILNPTDYTIEPRVLRGMILQAVGRLDEALHEFDLAIRQSPMNEQIAGQRKACADLVNRTRTKHALLSLDEALARHDENLNALAVLEAAPHFLRADPDVRQRLVRRRRGLRHMEDRDWYREWYGHGAGGDAPFHPIGDRTFQETVTWAADTLARTQFLLAGLRERHGDDLSGVTLLDVGCNDGWMGLWLVADHGLGRYVGMDLSEAAITRAREFAREYYPEVADRLEFVLGDFTARPLSRRVTRLTRIDAVSCFEVIEHVPDPDALLDRLEQAVRSVNGWDAPPAQVFLSTPNGSFENGNISDWDSPTPRGHVRAMRPAELARLALDHGQMDGLSVNPDRTITVAYTPRQRLGTVDFYLGPAGQSWSPTDVITKGLGGSETMAIRQALRLADMGWRVRVYGAVEHESAVHGVEYLPYWMHDPTETVDVLIVSRAPGYLRSVQGVPPGVRTFLWLHDAEYPDLADHVTDYDRVLCVGRWQARELFGDRWEETADVLRNGVGLADFREPALGFEERDPVVITSSSPDRGSIHVLRAWSEVHRRCEALGVSPRLVWAYGFTPTYDVAAQYRPWLNDLRREIEGLCASLPGVDAVGSIGQPDLHARMQRARVWAYPTSFPEVSCIGAMEAQMSGLAILTCDVAELRTTVKNPHALFPPVDEWDDAAREDYIDTMVRCLTDPDVFERFRGCDPIDARQTFNADHCADDLHEMVIAQVVPRASRWDIATPHTEPGADKA